MKNIWRSFPWLLPCAPVFMMLVFALYGWLVYRQLGHLPIPMKTSYPPYLRFIDDLAGISILVVITSLSLALFGLGAMFNHTDTSSFLRKPLAYYFALLVFLITCLFLTPLGSLLSWYID